MSNPLSTPVQNPLPALAAARQNESSFNEKQPDYFAPHPSAAVPPPAYAPSVEPPILASASALYQYVPSDTGDLAILPDDRIAITEFMNADWAKGRNERSGQWGIFPRSYVRVLDGKSVSSAPPPATPTSYGNMPLDVSHGGGAGAGGAGEGNESKLNQTGKKFGKKMGNAGESRKTIAGYFFGWFCFLIQPQPYSELELLLAQISSMGFSNGFGLLALKALKGLSRPLFNDKPFLSLSLRLLYMRTSCLSSSFTCRHFSGWVHFC